MRLSIRWRKAIRERIMWVLEPYLAGCWVELVMWAEFPALHEFGEVFEIIKGPSLACINDVQGEPYACYCARYKITGPTRWGGRESLVWESMEEVYREAK